MSAEQDVWNALVAAGLSSNQAAGVMGNVQNESSFNVESAAMDSNGQMSYGMIQWNAGSYPTANTLVTGNVAKDLASQVQFLLHNTNNVQRGLQGSTAADVAGNFAQYVEVCQGCQPGGAQYNQRVANAQKILQDAKTGSWQTGGPGTSAATTTALNPLNPLSWLGQLPGLGFLTTDWKDLAERLGLILLGAAMILIGIKMLSESFYKELTGQAPAPQTSKASNKTVPSPRKETRVVEKVPTATAVRGTGASTAIKAAAAV